MHHGTQPQLALNKSTIWIDKNFYMCILLSKESIEPIRDGILQRDLGSNHTLRVLYFAYHPSVARDDRIMLGIKKDIPPAMASMTS